MSKRLTGFTLIEALISITLSILVSTVGLLVYRDYYQHRIVRLVANNWAKEVKLLIKKSESASILNEVNGCQGEFEGVRIQTVSGDYHYSLEVRCSGHNSEVQEYQLNELESRHNVVFGHSVELKLLPLSRGLESGVQVPFCFKETTKCYYQVKVDKNGNVKVEEL